MCACVLDLLELFKTFPFLYGAVADYEELLVWFFASGSVSVLPIWFFFILAFLLVNPLTLFLNNTYIFVGCPI